MMRRPEPWALHRLARFEERYLYRLNLVPEGAEVRQDYGAELTPAICFAPDGPLEQIGPGSLTRWMGVPWQTDEASCNSSAEYAPSTYLSMPSYWGARVPDQVLSSQAWNRAQDAAAGPLQQLKHALYREDWLRDVRGVDYYGRIDNMVRLWSTLGILEPMATPPDLQKLGLPPSAHVETGRSKANPGTDAKPALIAKIEGLASDVPPGPAAAAGLAAPGAEHVPPRQRFRQGEV
jgi:L-lysine epsilon oxidase C-terminal domain